MKKVYIKIASKDCMSEVHAKVYEKSVHKNFK